MKKTLMIISSIIFYLIGIIILGFYLYLEVAPKVSMDELDRIILLFLLALFFYLGSLRSKYKILTIITNNQSTVNKM